MERPVKIVTVTDSQTTSNGYVLLEGRDAIVIDPNLEGEIVETLEKYQAVPGLAILTHEHADHIRGLEALRERYPQMRTVASLLCSERIQDIRSNLSRIFGVYLMFITGERVLDYPKFTCRAADVMFEGRLLFSWGAAAFCGHPPGWRPSGTGSSCRARKRRRCPSGFRDKRRSVSSRPAPAPTDKTSSRRPSSGFPHNGRRTARPDCRASPRCPCARETPSAVGSQSTCTKLAG